MKDHIAYEFHHMGSRRQRERDGEIFSAAAGMFTTDNPGRFRIQWHRFTDTSPLHPLIRTVPHPAFKVASLEEAMAGEELLLGPYEPIDGYRVAIIKRCRRAGRTDRDRAFDDEIWSRARSEKVRFIGGESLFVL